MSHQNCASSTSNSSLAFANRKQKLFENLDTIFELSIDKCARPSERSAEQRSWRPSSVDFNKIESIKTKSTTGLQEQSTGNNNRVLQAIRSAISLTESMTPFASCPQSDMAKQRHGQIFQFGADVTLYLTSLLVSPRLKDLKLTRLTHLSLSEMARF